MTRELARELRWQVSEYMVPLITTSKMDGGEVSSQRGEETLDKDEQSALQQLQTVSHALKQIMAAVAGADISEHLACIGRCVERLGSTDPLQSGPALTGNDRRILEQLTKSHTTLKQLDFTIDVSDRTIRQCLARLEECGLVCRPNGKRSGYAATTQGKALIAEQDARQ